MSIGVGAAGLQSRTEARSPGAPGSPATGTVTGHPTGRVIRDVLTSLGTDRRKCLLSASDGVGRSAIGGARPNPFNGPASASAVSVGNGSTMAPSPGSPSSLILGMLRGAWPFAEAPKTPSGRLGRWTGPAVHDCTCTWAGPSRQCRRSRHLLPRGHLLAHGDTNGSWAADAQATNRHESPRPVASRGARRRIR